MTTKVFEELREAEKSQAPGKDADDHVIDWARLHPNSVLHGVLEWDIAEAARHWRHHQIRMLRRTYTG